MKDVAGSWLAMQCKLTPGVSRAVVFLGEPDRGPFAAVARWPEGSADSQFLSAAAELAMADRRGVLRAPPEVDEGPPRDCDAVALPLVIEGRLWGSVACEVSHRPKAQQQPVIERLIEGCSWLAFLLRRNSSERRDRALTLLELVAVCLDQARFQAAATALATGLATRLGLERVSIGFLKRDHVEMHAVSHSAEFGKKADFVRQIEAAMDEAIDQQATISSPHLPDAPPSPTRAHDELKHRLGGAAVCTVPFSSDGRIVGAMTLERTDESEFDRDSIDLCEQVAALAGSVLELRRREDRWLVAKAAESFRTQLAELMGPKHLGLKLGAVTVLAALLILAVVRGDYRVTADATLEGTVRRVVVAAMDGFVVEEHARAGDVVSKGQTLAALDDRDLKLERLKWSSQRDQTLTEHREALAHRDWSQVNILSAQLAQADAQLALVDEQLARTKLVAPFDGIIVEGDLSQSLGSPVERGEVFFEIAPLDSYRIILEVDERDVGDLEVGQEGWLTLSSMPEQSFGLAVERITPISTAESGRNYFRVEASLEEPVALLRPGMEGVAKIGIDRRSLFWILTHELHDRARLWAWTWWP
jgi:RND family efflux transporter MFP subunit